MALPNAYPLRMAPPCKNPMQTHMQRRSWLTDRQHTHCADPVTWATVTTRRHKVVHQRAQLPKQRRRSGNRITQPRERTRKRHRNAKKKNTFVCVSVNTSTLQRIWHNGRYLLFSSVATHIDKDHRRQHVMGTAQDADKEACVRGRKELRQNTRRTDASEH